MNTEDGKDAQFEEITFLEYRGYCISLSAKGLSTLQPEIKYQIFVSKKDYSLGLDIYDSMDEIYLYESIETSIRMAREWVDMYETFHGWF
jgi:hypothetical protein